MSRFLAIALAFLLGVASIFIGVMVGVSAAIGVFVTVWGPNAILGPPPGFLAFMCFITIALIGMLMGMISSYVLIILPLAIRLNSWVLAGCDTRRIAYFADGLTKLMETWREDQLKHDDSGE